MSDIKFGHWSRGVTWTRHSLIRDRCGDVSVDVGVVVGVGDRRDTPELAFQGRSGGGLRGY